MTSAEMTFKNGFAPHLPTDGLRALLAACESDDMTLTQGSTTTPPPLMCVQDWPCEAACALGYVALNTMEVEKKTTHKGRPVPTVGAVEEFFASMCFKADTTIGEPAACRWFLNWFDDTPRDQMRRELAGWVRDVLNDRGDDNDARDPAPQPAAPPELAAAF